MELEGKVWKDKNFWLIEVPSLGLMTQGKTRKEAIEMLQDAIKETIRSYFTSLPRGFKTKVNDYGNKGVGIKTSDPKLLLALSLIRQREESGSTVREAAMRLGSKSPNSYAQYERGKTMMSLEKYDQLLQAANPVRHSVLRII